MLKVSNTKKTRFKLAIALEVFFAVVVMYALYSDHPQVAETTIAGMMTIGTGYLLGESYRKSEKDAKGTEEIFEVTEGDSKDRLDV